MSGIRVATRESGFTIVELLIYMVMFVVVLGSMYSIMISNTRSYSSQENRVEMTQDLRAAMNLMVREIRMAGCDPTDVDDIGFLGDDENEPDNDNYNTDGNSIHFTRDVTNTAGGGDPDGLTDGPHEDVNYYLYVAADGIQKIGRRTGSPGSRATSPLAENITGLTFIYYDTNGAVLAPPLSADDMEDIRQVQISITGQTATQDAVTGGMITRTQTTRVLIRNAGVD